MAQAICLGELLIDFVPTVTGTGLTDAPAFMGKVGDDAFGHFLADTLAEASLAAAPRCMPSMRLMGKRFRVRG